MSTPTDMFCSYGSNREETLVGYLYDDISSADRAAFAAHLATCERCRLELEALGGVREQLGRWAPPEPAMLHDVSAHAAVGSGVLRRLREIPVWAQTAAALLVLGVSAAIANVDVHYDRTGLTVRTGWSSRPAAPSVETAASQPAPAGVMSDVKLKTTPVRDADAPWRADLAALEQQLRAETRPDARADAAGAPLMRPVAAAAGDSDLLRRVRALIEESERRQQRELTLRVAEALREVSAQRQADLFKIDRSLRLIQNDTGITGIQVQRQSDLLNYLAVRVSQTKPQ